MIVFSFRNQISTGKKQNFVLEIKLFRTVLVGASVDGTEALVASCRCWCRRSDEAGKMEIPLRGVLIAAERGHGVDVDCTRQQRSLVVGISLSCLVSCAALHCKTSQFVPAAERRIREIYMMSRMVSRRPPLKTQSKL